MGNRLEESWVDLLTNTANVRNDFPETFSNILLGYKFPKTLLFGFLHEATHHWCFDSIYGNLLYILRIKSANELRDNLDRMPELNIDERWDLFSDNIKYKFILSIYRPILEGIALFAEFDTLPSETEALPPHLIFATMVFSGLDSDVKIKEHEEKYSNVLFNMRINYGVGIESKANLLSSALDVNKSPYLAGYLFIKNFWVTLLHKSDRFLDPNLFLYFIRNFFFNDVGLFDVVFRDSKDENAIEEIWYYFLERLQQLENFEMSDEQINVFENACITPNFWEGAANLFTPDHSRERGLLVLEEMFQKYINENADMVFANFLKRRFFRLFRLQGYIDISPVRIQVMVKIPFADTEQFSTSLASGFTKLIDGVYYKNMMSMPNEGAFMPQKAKGEIVSYVQFGPKKPALFFIKDGTVVYHDSLGRAQWDEEAINVILATSSTEDFGAADAIEDVVKALYELYPELQAMEEAIFEGYNDSLAALYNQSAIISVPEVRSAEVAEMMADYGLWQLTDGDEDVIRLFSIVSQCTSLKLIDKTTISEITGLYGIDFENTLAKVLKLQEKFDFHILEDSDRYIVARII